VTIIKNGYDSSNRRQKMKKVLIVIGVIVGALGLTSAFYPQPVEVKAPVQKDVWNRYGSGFELSSVQPALSVPVKKEAWNRTGSGFELSSLPGALPAPAQKEPWNRYGSGFELSSVRTITEIKASIQKYWWSEAGSGFELSSVPDAAQK
jgi:hypothetical protein